FPFCFSGAGRRPPSSRRLPGYILDWARYGGLTEICLDGNIGARRIRPFQALDSGRRSALRAEVAELADALHSGCSTRQGVEVRVLSSAPNSFVLVLAVFAISLKTGLVSWCL